MYSEQIVIYFLLAEYLSLCNTSDPCLSPGLKIDNGGPSGGDTSQEVSLTFLKLT